MTPEDLCFMVTWRLATRSRYHLSLSSRDDKATKTVKAVVVKCLQWQIALYHIDLKEQCIHVFFKTLGFFICHLDSSFKGTSGIFLFHTKVATCYCVLKFNYICGTVKKKKKTLVAAANTFSFPTRQNMTAWSVALSKQKNKSNKMGNIHLNPQMTNILHNMANHSFWTNSNIVKQSWLGQVSVQKSCFHPSTFSIVPVNLVCNTW